MWACSKHRDKKKGGGEQKTGFKFKSMNSFVGHLFQCGHVQNIEIRRRGGGGGGQFVGYV